MHNGGCLCGRIKYLVKSDLDFLVNCHCQFCRLAHGAEFVPVAMIAADKLDIVEGIEFLSEYEVKDVGAFRCFCSVCGTRIYNHLPAANSITLIVATLAEAPNVTPLANVNMESSNQFFTQTNGLPSFDTFPSLDERKNL